jgi:hypothetical protein
MAHCGCGEFTQLVQRMRSRKRRAHRTQSCASPLPGRLRREVTAEEKMLLVMTLLKQSMLLSNRRHLISKHRRH